MDEKMKKMGEMQLSSVTDSKKKKTILDQVIVLPCTDVSQSLGLERGVSAALEPRNILGYLLLVGLSPRLLDSLF